jgi:hypothetical protein
VAPTKQDEHIEDKHEHEDQQYRGHRVLLGEWFVGVHGVRWLLPSDAPVVHAFYVAQTLFKRQAIRARRASST